MAKLHGDQPRVCFVHRWSARTEAIQMEAKGWMDVNWADENEDAIGRSPCHIY